MSEHGSIQWALRFGAAVMRELHRHKPLKSTKDLLLAADVLERVADTRRDGNRAFAKRRYWKQKAEKAAQADQPRS